MASLSRQAEMLENELVETRQHKEYYKGLLTRLANSLGIKLDPKEVWISEDVINEALGHSLNGHRTKLNEQELSVCQDCGAGECELDEYTCKEYLKQQIKSVEGYRAKEIENWRESLRVANEITKGLDGKISELAATVDLRFGGDMTMTHKLARCIQRVRELTHRRLTLEEQGIVREAMETMRVKIEAILAKG